MTFGNGSLTFLFCMPMFRIAWSKPSVKRILSPNEMYYYIWLGNWIMQEFALPIWNWQAYAMRFELKLLGRKRSVEILLYYQNLLNRRVFPFPPLAVHLSRMSPVSLHRNKYLRAPLLLWWKALSPIPNTQSLWCLFMPKEMDHSSLRRAVQVSNNDNIQNRRSIIFFTSVICWKWKESLQFNCCSQNLWVLWGTFRLLIQP